MSAYLTPEEIKHGFPGFNKVIASAKERAKMSHPNRNQKKQSKGKQPKSKAQQPKQAQRARPLFELNVQVDGKSMNDLRQSTTAAVLGLFETVKGKAGEYVEVAKETFQKNVAEAPEGARKARQSIVNLLGLFGVEEVNFRGATYRPEVEDDTKGTKVEKE